MSVLLDADVLLDVVLERGEHCDDSSAVLDAAEVGAVQVFAAMHTIANVYYIGERMKRPPRDFIRNLCGFARVRGADENGVLSALGFPMKDFEDALGAWVALEARCSLIITRNLEDYENSPVPAVSPADFVASGFSENPDDYPTT